jgi:hypothetical protein
MEGVMEMRFVIRHLENSSQAFSKNVTGGGVEFHGN